MFMFVVIQDGHSIMIDVAAGDKSGSGEAVCILAISLHNSLTLNLYVITNSARKASFEVAQTTLAAF